jgi:uncharacterized protein YggE
MNTLTAFRRALIIITGLTLLGTSIQASAQPEEPFPRIQVTAEGSVDLAPDMAVLGLTVMREAKTARLALDANSAAMKQVLAALQKQGIAERDLQTANFSIQPRYVYPSSNAGGGRKQRKIVGYTVRNSLTVRVRDIANLGVILDQSVSLGVNEGGNIRFVNDDPAQALSQARTLAMQNAVAKANTLAKAGGVKVGKILEISEHSFPSHPVPMARAEMAMAAADTTVPMAAGENSYRVSVNVSFAIDQ